MFARIAAMGFSHVCLAPPFEPGEKRRHLSSTPLRSPASCPGISGSAEQGLALAAEQASRAGLQLMLDIAPGHVAVDFAVTAAAAGVVRP